MRQLLACAIVLAVVLAAPAMATDVGTIQGTLKMADGKTPVAGHAITVIDVKTDLPVYKARTDEKGAFMIASIPTGTYKVAAAENAFAIVEVPTLPEVLVVDLALPPTVLGQGVRPGAGGGAKGAIVAATVGLVLGGIIGGTIAYQQGKDEGEDHEEDKQRELQRQIDELRRQQASPSMP